MVAYGSKVYHSRHAELCLGLSSSTTLNANAGYLAWWFQRAERIEQIDAEIGDRLLLLDDVTLAPGWLFWTPMMVIRDTQSHAVTALGEAAFWIPSMYLMYVQTRIKRGMTRRHDFKVRVSQAYMCLHDKSYGKEQ